MPRSTLITANFRRGTTAQWASTNPVLAVDLANNNAPEIGMEWTGTRWLMKMGDGVTAWNSLPYAVTSILSTTATALSAGVAPTTSFNLATGVLAIGIPAGAAGLQGSSGIAGTMGLTGATGPSGTTILGSLASAFTLTNSNAESTVLSTTIPGNALGTSTALVRMVAHGYVTQTSIVGLAATLNFTINVKYGGQTLVAMNTVASRVAVLDNTAVFQMEVELFMRGGSASQQSIYSRIQQAASTGPFAVSADGGVILKRAAMTVDSTVAQPFVVTVQANNIVSTTSLVIEQVRIIRLG